MNLKSLIGTIFSRSLDALLSSRFFPLMRVVPHGISWVFDLQRFMGTRSLGAVFDVGANAGQTVTALIRYAPRAEIYSFEPGVQAFRALEAKFSGFKNVHLFNVALGAQVERRALHMSDDSELNTLVPRPAAGGSGSTQMVDVRTVDEIVASHGISHLDLLKMDVQGWEMEVLKGAKDLIANHNLIHVFAEVAFRSDQNEMQQFDELHRHLEGNGFVFCGFYEFLRYGPRREFVLFANALYLHPEARIKWTDMRAEWNRWLSAQKPNSGGA